MHFHSTLTAAAGAALFSVASAGHVCRLKSSPSNGGWTPANVQPKPQQPANNGGWSNWDGSPIVIRTTTLPHTYCNPQPTGGLPWGGWNGNPSSGGPVSPTGTYAPGQGWYPWNTVSGNPTANPTATSTASTTSTTSGTGIVLPTAGTTTSSTTFTTITTAPTSTTTSTTTTTTTTTTTALACPTGVFYLQAQNAENAAINNLYAGLANNGFGNLVAFSEADTTNAVQVTFDVDCSLISAFGPLIILDDATPVTFHYQYMNEEGTQQAGLTRSIDICAADANNNLSCSVNGESVLQTDGDILSIGDALYSQTLNVVLIPA